MVWFAQPKNRIGNIIVIVCCFPLYIVFVVTFTNIAERFLADIFRFVKNISISAIVQDKVFKYYLTEVDKVPQSIYCYHDFMGELRLDEHSHQKGQFLYTEGGLVHIKTPGKTYFLPGRHFMWIPPQLSHSIYTSSAQAVMRNLYFPIAENDVGFFKETGIYPVNDLLLQMLLYTNRWHGDLLPVDSEAFTFLSAIKSVLPDLSVTMLPLTLPLPTDKRLMEIVTYMAAHLEEPVLFGTVARQFGFSERSLSRLFMRNVGLSFVQYYTLQRMIRALELLADGNVSVSEVAISVGYNSIPSFSNIFYRLVGVRPSDYVRHGG